MKKFLQAIGLLFILGIGVPSFAATPTVVQKNVNSVPSGATNLGKAFTAATTAGNTIVVSCSAPNTTATLSVSDTINTYTAVGSAPTTQATAGSLQWFVAKNTTSVPNSTNVTCTQSGAAGGMFIFIYEIAGGSTTAPVDVPTAAQASGAAIASSATPSFTLPTTTVAHDLLLFASSCANTCSADASADAGTSQNDTIGDTAETYAKSATGTYTGLFNQTAGAAIVVGVAITDGVGGGGGGGATVNKRAKLEKMYAALKLKVSGMGAIVAAIPTLDQLTGMFTWRGDLTHQSADSAQTILTTTNVTGTSFKKTWQFATADADIKTQPLIAANLRFPDKVRNVTYIASMGNTAYALDADTGQLLWKTDLNAGEAPANAVDVMSCNDVIGTVGVISSGAIDPITRTIYYLAKTEVAGPTFKYRMHALDIMTGAERNGSPVLVTASVPGTGAGSSAGSINLDPHHNNNTSGAVIANGLIYFTFSSHCDDVPYHGWILAYDLKSFQQKYVWANAPNSGTSSSKEGGPWMSGAPPAIDELGNLYVTTGCADFNGTDAFGESLIKLSPTLTVLDSFTPFDWASMNASDFDLGASGVTLLPDQPNGRLVVHGGKSHNLYVENRNNLGGNHASDNNQIVQYLSATFPGTDFGDNGMFATPLYWNGKLYFCIADTTTARGCQMRTLTNGVVASSASSTTGDVCHVRTCGGFITSTGLTNGIFWMYDNDTTISKARLYAYDATNLATKLYDSEANAARDSCPMAGSKWTNPTVYNGKVYIVGTTGICAYANF